MNIRSDGVQAGFFLFFGRAGDNVVSGRIFPYRIRGNPVTVYGNHDRFLIFLKFFSFNERHNVKSPSQLLFPHIINAQIAANFPRKKVIYFRMPRYRGGPPGKRIKKDAMASALPDEYASFAYKMRNQISPLHRAKTLIGSRIARRPSILLNIRFVSSTKKSASWRFSFVSLSVFPCVFTPETSSTKPTHHFPLRQSAFPYGSSRVLFGFPYSPPLPPSFFPHPSFFAGAKSRTAGVLP